MEKKKDERLKNIIKLRDGAYEIQISNGTREDGKRDRITETFYGSEEQAIARRDEIKKQLKELKEKGIKTANDGYTFLEVAKLFIEDKKYGKRIGTTVSSYKTYLNNYIIPEIGFKKIRNITTEDLEKLCDKMSKMPSRSTNSCLSGTTIKHAHTLVKTIFNYAIHKKWIFYNPAEFVENKPKFDTKERDYYDHEEIQFTLSCLDKIPNCKNGVSNKVVYSQNLRFKTAIVILFNSGLRREELFGLKWKDIKWHTHIFEIRRAVVSIDAKEFDAEDIIEILGKKLVCKKLKNDPSRRNITMPIVCFDFLVDYKKNQIEMGLPVGDDDYVFQNIRIRGSWHPNNLTSEWAKFVDMFNLKKITVHDIRHSHATDLLSMGVPIQDVSRRLGHSDVGTTLKIYTHSNMSQDKLIAEKLESRYNNCYVSSKLNFEIIASIIVGENYADEFDVKNAVSYITGKTINQENEKLLMAMCKNHLLNQYSYLQSITLFLNKEVTNEIKQAFINLINGLGKNLSDIRPMNDF